MLHFSLKAVILLCFALSLIFCDGSRALQNIEGENIVIPADNSEENVPEESNWIEDPDEDLAFTNGTANSTFVLDEGKKAFI